MSQLPFQWPVNLFRGSLTKDISKGAVGTYRSFHVSQSRTAEDSDSGGVPPTRPDRPTRSQDAARRIAGLRPRQLGLRGGAFKNATTLKPAADRKLPLRQAVSPNQNVPPPGMVIARRRVPSPSRQGQGQMVRGGFRGGRGGALSSRGGRGNRGRGRGERGRGRGKGRGGGTGTNISTELDESQLEMTEDGASLSTTMVKWLAEEHERIKGEKEHQLQMPNKQALLDLTKTSLPPMKVHAQKQLTQYLEGTTPMSWDRMAMDLGHLHRGRAKRLIEGLPVRVRNQHDINKMTQATTSKRMASVREAAAKAMEAEGLKPSDAIEFKQFSEDVQKKTMLRVLAGQYELSSKPSEEASKEEVIRQTAIRHLQSNPSYQLKNKDAFLNVVEGLIKGKTQGKAPKMGLN